MKTVKENILILGIESSCDETSASISKGNKILANIIANQTVHAKYGGVVPELASRAHQKHIIPVVQQALNEAKVDKNDLDAVAFTRGPGLLGSLLVGISFAKTFAQALNLPIIEVNHMHAHAISACIQENEKSKVPSFPFLCLTVSGGHTQILKVSSHTELQILGQTTDDAAGEAFDKVAKLMGLPYPGGPEIDKLAKQGNEVAFTFPHPNVGEYDYSFSGFKTSFLNFIRKEKQKNPAFIEENKADLCASVQHNIIQILLKKLVMAIDDTEITQIAIAGGVSANSGLRKAMQELAAEKNLDLFIPALEYCTDNAAMIAITGFYKYLDDDFSQLDVTPMARYPVVQ
ncbi:MAG: tRNA (adenosine(37)-N6)-threonylcarbamoyltransferase complex transferase subunit TsaD [Bacteroidia bacterium]|nr:tRNA (adenosine(37)-N6)-threonylcarbamoyltransferase complex transferase subunit TsaD [Bacteroidia bacterium]